MNGNVSPTMRRRRLARRIRERREAHGFTGIEMARRIGKINQSQWSKIERGAAKPTDWQLRKVFEILEVPPLQAQEWYELHRCGDQLGWWSEYGDVLPEHGEMLADLESDAVHVRQYIEAFIPSFLATEEYTHAVVHSSQNARPSDMARIVEFRMQRQRRLDDPGFRYTVVLAEGALHRHVGGRDVLVRQLRHLLDTQWPATVEVLVVPFEADVYAAQGMSFEIMEFSDPDDPECVFIELAAPSSAFLEKPSELRYYNNMYSVAASKALDVGKSRERIDQVRAGLSR